MTRPAAFLLAFSLSCPLQAATLVVTSSADTSIVDGACTLREALAAANNTTVADCGTGQPAPVVDIIAFAIPGAGPHTIKPTGYLGAISETLTMDGITQAGAVPNGGGRPIRQQRACGQRLAGHRLRRAGSTRT